jgi:hypothetical protein
MVHAESLGDFQEPDQLEPVETLGAGLVAVYLGQPGVDGGIAGNQGVDLGEPEQALSNPTTRPST